MKIGADEAVGTKPFVSTCAYWGILSAGSAARNRSRFPDGKEKRWRISLNTK
jgi:hypothetical protein